MQLNFKTYKEVYCEFLIKRYWLELKEVLVLGDLIHFDLNQSMALPILTHSHILIYDGMFHSNLNILCDKPVIFFNIFQFKYRINRFLFISNKLINLVVCRQVLKGKVVPCYRVFYPHFIIHKNSTVYAHSAFDRNRVLKSPNTVQHTLA